MSQTSRCIAQDSEKLVDLLVVDIDFHLLYQLDVDLGNQHKKFGDHFFSNVLDVVLFSKPTLAIL